jgi:hypothetical protein
LNKKPCILNGKTDSWNIGILLYEMLTKFEAPFKGKNNEEFIKAILNCEIDLEPIKDEFCRDLISKLVRKNPQDRIDIDKVLEMDYIINNVLIEQPEIDFSDNIINPIDEQEFLNAMNNSNNNQNKPQPDTKNAPNPVKTPSESANKNQHLNKELTNLKSENDNLKQLVEDLRKQVVSSGRKKRASKHVSKLKSMVIDVGGEIIADQNIQGEPQEKEENNDGANLEDILNEGEDTQKQEEKKTEKKIFYSNKNNRGLNISNQGKKIYLRTSNKKNININNLNTNLNNNLNDNNTVKDEKNSNNDNSISVTKQINPANLSHNFLSPSGNIITDIFFVRNLEGKNFNTAKGTTKNIFYDDKDEKQKRFPSAINNKLIQDNSNNKLL